MSDFNVTSAQYFNDTIVTGTTSGIKATIDGEVMIVPIDAGNVHYAAIKAKHDDADDSFTIQDAS